MYLRPFLDGLLHNESFAEYNDLKFVIALETPQQFFHWNRSVEISYANSPPRALDVPVSIPTRADRR